MVAPHCYTFRWNLFISVSVPTHWCFQNLLHLVRLLILWSITQEERVWISRLSLSMQLECAKPVGMPSSALNGGMMCSFAIWANNVNNLRPLNKPRHDLIRLWHKVSSQNSLLEYKFRVSFLHDHVGVNQKYLSASIITTPSLLFSPERGASTVLVSAEDFSSNAPRKKPLFCFLNVTQCRFSSAYSTSCCFAWRTSCTWWRLQEVRRACLCTLCSLP